jgi:uncharacterized membrane protein
MVSCEEKLPSNISGALSWYNMNIESLNKVDSIIINLSDEDIEKLQPDSAFSLYAKHINYLESTDKASKELEDFLKFNPEYSDYSEVKNRTYHFTIMNRIPYELGRGKINDRVDKLYEHYYSKQ